MTKLPYVVQLERHLARVNNNTFFGQKLNGRARHLSAHAVQNLVLYGTLVTQSESEGGVCAYHSIHIINADQKRQNQLAYRSVVQESANAVATWCHSAT